MKKLILSLVAALSIVGANAASVTVTVPGNTSSNLMGVIQGPVTLLSVVLTAPTSTNVAVYSYDNSTNQLSYTNNSYVSTASYVSNVIVTWTNFFGATNSYTNAALVDVSITNAASTNLAPVRWALSTLGGTSAQIQDAQFQYLKGAWVTNTSTGTAQITVQYTK